MLVHAGLGSMPWDVLSQGVSRRTGHSFGTVTLVLSALVLACWIPLRQRPGIGTVANVLVIGLLVDPALALLDRLPESLPLVARIALVLGGIVLNAVATGLYIGARLGPGPRDGLMTGLVARTGRSVRLVRTSIEVVVVAVGWALGGTVGLGTLAFALAIGPLVHLLLPVLSVPALVEPDPVPAPLPVPVPGPAPAPTPAAVAPPRG
ncbi:YczE/YyaS/YitT family protein [Cellulomonas soli]|uniref:membrane protein YczE n=1 Tax=Cellulomonas soli TaxID=931535 RepID=UPI003F84628A